MKYTVIFLFFVLSVAAHAQAVFSPVCEAVKNGNVSELVKYFNTSIDINIEGKTNTFNKAQAQSLLSDFFKKHTPADFTIVHSGSSKGGLQFAMGKFKSGNDSFDVLMRAREVEKTYLLHELSFTKE